MHSNEMLKTVCDDIELITGIKTVIYDENKKIIHRQSNMMCAFCLEVRRSAALTEKCLACDAYGFAKSARERDICIYHCHMGLTEAVAPVMENGRTVGYLMLGQILRKDERERVKKCIEALGGEIDREALYQHLDAMSETDEHHLRATARMLAMSAAYVRSHELLTQRKSTLAYKIENYVFENIAAPTLSAQGICAALGFSRTALYNTCKSSFGTGIAEYVQKIRAEHAVHLLRSTRLPLARVAEGVGLTSTARLNRLLKTQTGMTAKKLRRQSTAT
ncbi:MAG: PocR ligand-binding domain-containing protein [Clostridia bacterium]|nr:PocR ligand-binding domain-containing protein [Clostridia bacterium]